MGLSVVAYLGWLGFTPVYIAPHPRLPLHSPNPLVHFTMASPSVELDPELAEKEEWEAAELAATIAAFERHKLEEEETEEWEAAGLMAMEQYERTQRKQSRLEREQHEPQREEMQKKLRVEEVAAKKAAANARKD